jgi:hypothetical protein
LSWLGDADVTGVGEVGVWAQALGKNRDIERQEAEAIFTRVNLKTEM